MKQKGYGKKPNFGYYTALVVGIVALALLLGVYTYRNGNTDSNQYVDLNAEEDSYADNANEETAAVGADVADASNSAVADANSSNTANIGKADLASNTTNENATTQTTENGENTQTTENTETSEDTKMRKGTEIGETTQQNSTSENKTSESESTTSQVEAASNTVAFSKNANLSWPVIKGKIILPFSMDTTVYYQTLDEYKCNSGMVIQARKGAGVSSAYAGKVTKISEDSSYGKMVSVDIGGGYTLIYGQLNDIQVSEGQTISQGELIGNIAKPTSMFTTEGTNLYFAMQKDGKYINPEKFLTD